MAAYSKTICHVTKLKSSQSAFLQHHTVLRWSPQPPDLNLTEWQAPLGYCGFIFWMSSQQILSNFLMLSCQYGSKSLRNVSNTLLKLCHKDFRQSFTQEWHNYNGRHSDTQKTNHFSCLFECIFLYILMLFFAQLLLHLFPCCYSWQSHF